MSEIIIKSPKNQSISVSLTDEIRKILESSGLYWFELKGTVKVNSKTFKKIDALVTPTIAKS